MSLNQPLAKPLSLPLAKPLTGLDQDYFDAVAALGECWPLTNTLAGSQGTPITLTRASAAIYENVLGKYQKFATNTPALSGGWLDVSGQIQNKCTNYNLNPTDLTNVNLVDGGTGATLELVSDEVELRAAGFGDLLDSGGINGNVYKLTSGTSFADAQFLGTTANTNIHSLSIISRVGSGSATLFLEGNLGSGETFTNTSYLKIDNNNQTPTLSTRFARVRALSAGDVVYFFANMLTETSTAPESLIECAGAAGTQALDDVQVSTTGWPVNDCAYYIELPKGIVDNGVNQYLFDSTVDASNWFRILFISGANLIRLSLRNTAVTVNLDVSYTADGTPIDLLLTADSTSGKSVYCSNGEIDTDASTVNLVFDTTCQIAAFNNLTLNLFAPIKMLKRFNSSDITLEGARDAC